MPEALTPTPQEWLDERGPVIAALAKIADDRAATYGWFIQHGSDHTGVNDWDDNAWTGLYEGIGRDPTRYLWDADLMMQQVARLEINAAAQAEQVMINQCLFGIRQLKAFDGQVTQASWEEAWACCGQWMRYVQAVDDQERESAKGIDGRLRRVYVTWLPI